MKANLNGNGRPVCRLVVLAVCMAAPGLAGATEEVTPIIVGDPIAMPEWREMKGLGWDPSHPSRLFISCDNKGPGYYDTVAQVRFDVKPVEVVTHTGNGEAKGATFDGTYVWAIGCDKPGVQCSQRRLKRWNDDLTGEVFWPISDTSSGIAWDGEALWIAHNAPEPVGGDTITRYTIPEPGQPIEPIPGSQIVVDFSSWDLAWRNGYLWASDWTNRVIKKIDPSSGAVVEVWTCPWPADPRPGGLVWGTYDNKDVLWCADLGTDKMYALTAVEPGVIPTLSVWGLVVLALLLLTLGKVGFARRHSVVRE